MTSTEGTHENPDTDQAYNEHRFSECVTLAAAQGRVLASLEPLDRTRVMSTSEADGEVLGAAVRARRDVPGYERAAMDGYAVRAADTVDATDDAPVVLSRTEEAVTKGEARPVHTGSELPDGADSVVRVERIRRDGTEIALTAPAPVGNNIAPSDEDVGEGDQLFGPGHRLRPPDLGLLKSVGVREVDVRDQPSVRVIPTGEELVEADPSPGEVIETNGLTVTRYAEQWGGAAICREPVSDDHAALCDALDNDLDADLIVTIGGSSVGERDLLPDVIEDQGELLVHGVAIKPGHPVGYGLVRGVPILLLPGYPVSSIVTAVQLLRPAIARLCGRPLSPIPSIRARLTGEIESDPHTRTYTRVRVTPRVDHTDSDGSDPGWSADPVRAAGAGELSSVGRADGWVVAPESRETIPDGKVVTVQNWDWKP